MCVMGNYYIKELREERGWPQEKLGELMGNKDKNFISRLENGATELKVSQLVRLAEIFDVSELDVIYGTDYHLKASRDSRYVCCAVKAAEEYLAIKKIKVTTSQKADFIDEIFKAMKSQKTDELGDYIINLIAINLKIK